jgi:hypothetical protein
MAFFEKNCHIFSEEEENKLEYTNVYEAYVKLIEQLIEINLKEKYSVSDEDVKAFYETLKQEGAITTYQALNNDTLEILFGFIDFDKFKISMLDAKKGMINTEESKNIEEYKDQVKADESISYEDFQKLFNEDLNRRRLLMEFSLRFIRERIHQENRI